MLIWFAIRPGVKNLTNSSTLFLVNCLCFLFQNMSSDVGSAVKEALSFSLMLKLVSFAISVLTVRFTSITDYGKISVHFQLLTSASMFVLKEGVRRAALKSDFGMEIMVFGVSFTSLVVVPLGALFFSSLSSEPFWFILLVSVSLVLECVAELFMFYQVSIKGNLGIRNRAETWSSLARAAVMLIVLIFVRDGGVFAFACSQVSSAILLVSVPAYFQLRIPLPVRTMPTKVRRQLGEMCVMSVQKLVLAEGERLLSIVFLSPDQIGLVSVVSNFGSLVLRLVFAPIEEVAFTGMTKVRNYAKNISIFKSVFLVQSAVGLLAACFGPVLSESVLALLYGEKWLDAVPLLQMYCVMILVFSVNGCFEAFFFASADSTRIRMSFVAQWVSFAAMVLSVSGLAGYGPICILIGNTVSMAVRIAFASISFKQVTDVFHPNCVRVYRTILVGGLCNAVLVRQGQGYHKRLPLGVGLLVGGFTVLLVSLPLRRVLTNLTSK